MRSLSGLWGCRVRCTLSTLRRSAASVFKRCPTIDPESMFAASIHLASVSRYRLGNWYPAALPTADLASNSFLAAAVASSIRSLNSAVLVPFPPEKQECSDRCQLPTSRGLPLQRALSLLPRSEVLSQWGQMIPGVQGGGSSVVQDP